MTAQQVTNLNTLMALFDTDADAVVNTIAEILAIFAEYPEGVDLVTALAAKVDKTSIVNDLTTGGATNVLSAEQGKLLNVNVESNEDRIDVLEPLVELAQQDVIKKSNGFLDSIAYTDSDGTTYTYRELFETMNEVTAIDGGSWFKQDANESIEFVDDYANYIGLNSRTSLRYSHAITVTSGERFYVATIIKNGVIPSTVYFRTNFSATTGLNFSTYSDFQFLSTILSANVTGASTMGYQQTVATAKEGLSISFKQSYVINLDGFATEPTQAQLDTMIQTYLEYQDELSMVEKAVYAQELTGTDYIDDNIYVQHITSTNLSEYIIFKQASYGDGNYYLGTKFYNLAVSADNANVWHLGQVNLYTKLEDVFTIVANTTFVLSGEWECALKETGAIDFMGGNAHGDEVYTDFLFLLDGKVLLPTGNYIEIGKNIEILVNSKLNRVGTPADFVAEHYKHLLINKKEIILTQRIKWLQEVILDASYLTMLPVNRDISSVVVTNKGFFDEDYVLLDFGPSHTNNGYRLNSKSVSIYNNGNGHLFHARVEEMQGSDNNEFVNVTNSASPNYNKIYFGYTAGKTTAVNEVWNYKSRYIYDYSGVLE